MKHFICLITLFLVFSHFTLNAQTEVYGYVKDAQTKEALPFVNVYFQGTQTGMTTDIKGFFDLVVNKKADTLVVSYIGYKTKKVPVVANKITEVEIELEQDIIALNEVIVRPGENPAFKVMRKVVENKSRYNKKKIDYYEMESYTKIEAYIDKMTSTLENRKVIQKIVATVDSIAPLRNKKGQKMIPVFFSESISRLYRRNNPDLSKEEVINSNIKGILVGENSIAQQFVGATFQEYNFYEDWMVLFEKQFVSPLANAWKLYYNYELIDSLVIDGKMHYQLEFEPKNKQNLAFIGKMLIEKDSYTLKSINANLTENTNINYLSGMQIDQEMKLFKDQSILLPEKVDVKLDVDPILGVYPGMYVQFNISYQDFTFDNPKPRDFFDVPVKILPKPAVTDNAEFWQQKRHVPLSQGNQQITTMIDDIRDIKMVKTYENLLQFALTGYFEWGKFDVGPYPYFYTFNDIEGSRFQIGGRTNELLSSKWELDAYLAYGERDNEFKYKAALTHIISRAPWRTVSYTHSYDLVQLGLKDVDPDDNPFFYASSRFGTLIKPYYSRTNQLLFKNDIRNGLSFEAGIKSASIHPDFDFGFYENTVDSTGFKNSFKTGELKFGIRYAKGEKFLIDGNRKLVVGRNPWPIFTLDYTAGIKGLLNGDFNYHQVTAGINHYIPYDGIGLGRVNFEAGKMFSTVPYPLLKVHTGNEGFFFSSAAFNLMNFYEFLSDSYVSLKYTHYFEGIILNHVPLLKKLNWRLVGIANVVYGNMSAENKALAGEEFGTEEGFFTLGDKPYIEVGYGVENILKVIRVDFYHRLTYLNNPDISKFGVKLNFQLIL
ncbi:DUF5686 family protein [Marivirga lumbricoides]|uniref:DUF5686 family protein n=1 Tax=Marivirga lumbricoides TaxID=1046115 RepID=UPI00166AB89B